MKKNMKRFCLTVGLALLVLAACQTSTAAPTESAQPTSQPAQPAAITSQNAAGLQATYQASEINQIADLVWSTDGSILIALSGSGAARYNGNNLEKLDTYTFDSPALLYAASPDGKTLAFSEDRYNIQLVDASQSQEAGTIYSPSMIGVLDFSPYGKTLLTTSMDELLVTLWDTTNGEIQSSLDNFETAAPVYSAKFGEDGLHIIWISRAKVQLSDIAAQEIGPAMEHEDFVVSAALSPNGNLLATAAAGTVEGEFQPVIYLWNPASGEITATLTNPEAFSVVTFSPHGDLLVAASDSTLLLWDTASLELVAKIPSSADNIVALAFSPDGTSIATADLSGSITLWQVQ